VSAAKELGAGTRVVSLPCFTRFERQPLEYRNDVLPPSCTKRVSIEAGVTLGWQRYVGPQGRSIGIDTFGSSAPGDVVMEKKGITAAAVVAAAKAL
jgi:transketolase